MKRKISGIKLISVDLFRTLVDLDPTPQIMWEIFLKDKYAPAISRQHLHRSAEILDRIWDEAGAGGDNFKNVRAVLEETCRQLFDEIHLDLDLRSAADRLMQKHRIHHLFEDARPFLESAGKTYPLCLSTDCDLEMLDGVGQLYPFKHIFVSESLEAYKLNPKFFQHVIRHCNLQPREILHIGDSKSDIIAPVQLEIKTCWLNRGHQPWLHPSKPDFEVHSLLEVLDLLGLATSTATP